MKTNKEQAKDKVTKTDGVTKNVTGEQSIKTSETNILKDKKGEKNKEVLIGKKLEKVDKIEEGYNTLERKILNKLMK